MVLHWVDVISLNSWHYKVATYEKRLEFVGRGKQGVNCMWSNMGGVDFSGMGMVRNQELGEAGRGEGRGRMRGANAVTEHMNTFAG